MTPTVRPSIGTAVCHASSVNPLASSKRAWAPASSLEASRALRALVATAAGVLHVTMGATFGVLLWDDGGVTASHLQVTQARRPLPCVGVRRGLPRLRNTRGHARASGRYARTSAPPRCR